jgi:N6-adenosine-specific RNA methylase IME4
MITGIRVPEGGFRAILVDPPWRFKTYNDKGRNRCPDWKNFKGSPAKHYETMAVEEITELPIRKLAADDAVLFLWTSWPMLEDALWVIRSWGFTYKTCAFDWMKANTSQIDMFRDDADATIGLGYWTRSNTEPCLLAVRGKPKRRSKGERMGIIEPRREHSRKPDCAHDRIERLVDGPYLEMFARRRRPGWSAWGDQLESSSQPVTNPELSMMGPEERVRALIKREGRLNTQAGPLFT